MTRDEWIAMNKDLRHEEASIQGQVKKTEDQLRQAKSIQGNEVKVNELKAQAKELQEKLDRVRSNMEKNTQRYQAANRSLKDKIGDYKAVAKQEIEGIKKNLKDPDKVIPAAMEALGALSPDPERVNMLKKQEVAAIVRNVEEFEKRENKEVRKQDETKKDKEAVKKTEKEEKKQEKDEQKTEKEEIKAAKEEKKAEIAEKKAEKAAEQDKRKTLDDLPKVNYKEMGESLMSEKVEKSKEEAERAMRLEQIMREKELRRGQERDRDR
ncbi:hypothetical protein LX64_02571 [Chitinophaga skermanii]|uniref:Uncharacterized protein n=1 Tax=Chitinophaga skermanii TaxID=331697 RepID=A0A327QPY4_9BACT|nr:hypothetical protein [Chitinophaga skermanii]RAJ05413.1 hypothetical protein LX64_02571 [Chitinophaga skermanii]